MSVLRISAPGDPDFEPRVHAAVHRTAELPEEIERAARAVIAEVRARGDAAVRAFTEKFEKRTLESFELPRDQWNTAAAQVAPNVRAALERAAARIRAFHEREKHPGFELEEDGIRLALRVHPIDRVAVYVPGGTARYPSTVLMAAIPAKVAGVPEVVMATPGPSPETLAAALVAGVDRVFVIGGAQAIAALAYGTESVPRVDKIVGPGNAYVTAAKRQVFGDVGIDMIAGPTEVVIAADDTADPAWVAADLLAQAEHDALAAPILVAVGRPVAERVAAEVERQLAVLPKRQFAEAALRGQGVAFVVPTVAQAIELLDQLAPEHACLAIAGAAAAARQVTRAGAVFVGHHASEAIGDYYAGPSHVLPTGGSARFASPLGVADFLKRTSFIEYDAAAVARHAPDIAALAEVEDLVGHSRSVTIRLGKTGGNP
jgi:histidinol dehydrogenase